MKFWIYILFPRAVLKKKCSEWQIYHCRFALSSKLDSFYVLFYKIHQGNLLKCVPHVQYDFLFYNNSIIVIWRSRCHSSCLCLNFLSMEAERALQFPKEHLLEANGHCFFLLPKWPPWDPWNDSLDMNSSWHWTQETKPWKIWKPFKSTPSIIFIASFHGNLLML